MMHQHSGRKLSRRAEHRKSMLANLAVSLIQNGRIKTTDPKAKEVRPFIERMITFAKRGDVHARRVVLSRLRDALAVKKLFTEIGPRFVDRNGGYTRIVKLGFRSGDNAPVSLIEFVGEEETKKAPAKKRKTTAKETTKDTAAETTVKTATRKKAASKVAPVAESEVTEPQAVETEAPAAGEENS